MPRSARFLGLLLLVLLSFPSSSLRAETVELVTYYPSTVNAGNLNADQIGVNTNAPQGLLHVVGIDNGVSRVLFTRGAGVSDVLFGIGTATPQAMLDIRHPQDAVFLRLQGAGDGTNFSGMELRSDEATDKIWQFVHKQVGPSLNSLHVNYSPDNGTTWNTRMAINPAGSVGIGTTTPAATALLELNSTTQGFLPPRLNQAQITTLATQNPPAGLMVYNNNTNQLNFYNGTTWTVVESKSAGGGLTQVVFDSTPTPWQVPPGVTQIIVEVWGGGGGGGGANVSGYWGHGGGGGGYGKIVLAVTPGEFLDITVGTGGTGRGQVSTNGTAGGASSVRRGVTTLISANGGGGGLGNGYLGFVLAVGAGGAGPAAPALGITGGRGNRVIRGISSAGGNGANGGAGGVANWSDWAAGPGFVHVEVTPGTAPGGGGAGWIYLAGYTHTGNNDGAPGRVVITY